MSQDFDAIVAALTSPEGQALLASLAGGSDRLSPAQQQRLRDRHGRDTVLLALRVAEAREGARSRFPDAGCLLFVPELLSQATAHPVAARRARRMAEALAADDTVLDLGCGAGSDLTRMAAAGLDVRGLERDPLAAALARANLEAVSGEGLVLLGEFPADDLPEHSILVTDPARRTGPRRPGGTRRLTRPEDLSPRPSDLAPILGAAQGWCVKWGPGLDLDHDVLTAPGALLEGVPVTGYQMELVSWNGSVREASLWGGRLNDPTGPRRKAVVLSGPCDDALDHEWSGDPEAPPPAVAAPGDWLLEPDGAVLRAGLMNDLALERGWNLLAPGIAYLTSDAPSPDPLARSWRRLASLPWSLRALDDALASHGAGRVAVKTRGFPMTPEEVVRGLNLDGDRELVVFLHRDGDGHTAHIAEPIHQGDPS